MIKNLRWKIVTIVVVLVVFAGLGVYPLLAARYNLPAPAWLKSKQLKLGLDLKGGVHLVMRVETGEALRIFTTTSSEQLRESLRTAGVAPTITLDSEKAFKVEGVPADRDAEFRRIADEQLAESYARSPGANGSYTFTMKPDVEADMREQTVVQALETIDRRVNELGVTEPNISRYGQSQDQIMVQMPGIGDIARAKDIIGKTALLELKIVEAGPAPTREALLQAHGGQVPQDMEVVSGAGGSGDTGTSFYLVRKVAGVTGADLRGASPTIDENNRPAVRFLLTGDGARKFGKVTSENINRQLAIILDGRVQSAPNIESRITDEGRITGSFTSEEVNDLALVLRSGALPAPMSYLYESVIGPSLGAASVRSGVLASLAGLSLVILFMLTYYKLSGINAVVAMVANLIILLGLMAYLGAAMTLPGIAGFILTMGMGVDSNVLIFERIKEELGAQRGARAAINASFSRVFLTLLDTHVTSLIAAAFLFQFGTGPIRGFAVTLTIGLLTNLFTSIFVSKTLFELALSRRAATSKTISI
jgi:preprotein translocase subunit SecD